MMTVREIQQVLAAHQDELSAYGVDTLSIFGSVARGDDHGGSDIDLLVRFHQPIGLFRFARLQRMLSTWLQRPVDLVPEDSLKPRMRAHVLAEAIDAT